MVIGLMSAPSAGAQAPTHPQTTSDTTARTTVAPTLAPGMTPLVAPVGGIPGGSIPGGSIPGRTTSGGSPLDSVPVTTGPVGASGNLSSYPNIESRSTARHERYFGPLCGWLLEVQQIEANSQIEAGLKARMLEHYRHAQGSLDAATRARASTASMRANIAKGPQELRQNVPVFAPRTVPTSVSDLGLPAGVTLETLERLSAKAQSAETKVTTDQLNLERQLVTLRSRPGEIRVELERLRKRSAELEDTLNRGHPSTEAPELALAERNSAAGRTRCERRDDRTAKPRTIAARNPISGNHFSPRRHYAITRGRSGGGQVAPQCAF